MTDMTTTQNLASLIGLYFLSAGIGFFVARADMLAMFNELKTQIMLGYFAGIMAFAIGGAIVAVHNDWSSFLAGCVSLFGWISLTEGVLMLAFRERFLSLFDSWLVVEKFITGMSVFTICAGIALLVAGLSG